MIAEAGHFALVLALAVALAQATLPMLGAHRDNALLIALAEPAAAAQAMLVAFAFGALTYAFVVSDFSLAVVAQNSNTAMPMLYKVSGVWGNHEGSMLLWVFILAIFGSAVALFGGNLPSAFRARVLAVQAAVAVGFYLFLLLTSNPFARIYPPPLNGRDLNPLLQDPGLAFHPPMLYLGYVGFSMAFSFAIAALIEGRVDAAWARWVRPWTLAAWSFLTGGIALGSWWAYYELGWGGWWYWDPVENASFMPWLAGTALLHSAIVVEKRDALKGWTVFLAIVAFSLSLLGTFLVRSGVLTSVHAFATDPKRGVFILLLLVLVTGGSFALFATRGAKLTGGGLFQPVSREGGLLLNNLLLATATAAVLLGTLYPLFIDAIGAGKISVGPPFFNAVFIPIMVPLIAAMAAGPLLGWKRAELWAALQRLWGALAAAVVVGVVAWWLMGAREPLGALGLTLAAWLGVATLLELGERIRLFRAPIGETLARLARLPRASLGMTLAHLGLALAIVGMAGTAWKSEIVRALKPGESIAVGGFDVTFQGARETRGPNYTATEAGFIARRQGREIAVMTPQKRVYSVQGMPTTEAAIRTTLAGDLYVVIGDAEGDEGAFVVRAYYNPLVAWMWIGSLIMILGGVLSISDRRYRVGVPAARRAPTTAKA